MQADEAAEQHLAQANAALVGRNAIVNKGCFTVTALVWDHERPRNFDKCAAAGLPIGPGVQAG